MFTAWLSAFVVTELVEAPLYARLGRCGILRALGASAITHPIVWFGFFHPAVPGSYWPKVIAAELFAWLAEAAYFARPLGWRRALGLSLLANAASVAVGLTLRKLFGWP